MSSKKINKYSPLYWEKEKERRAEKKQYVQEKSVEAAIV